MNYFRNPVVVSYALLALVYSCHQNNAAPSRDLIAELHLKKGDVISCGSGAGGFGTVDFKITGNDKVNKDFILGLELLHSFEYDEAEKVFSKIIGEAPQCAMAYWGVAMSNYHPLWESPTEDNLKKGSQAIAIAQSIREKTTMEAGFINAVAAYYKDWKLTDPRTRALHFEKGMEDLYVAFPTEKEAAIFYALALDAAAAQVDKSYAKQRKAGAILDSLYAIAPNHPGIVHYIIHTYDYPELAIRALPAARRYATVAPSSAHAQHMPSHIFTRLGMWDEVIKSNLQSVSSARCYAEAAGIKGHWDEELHGLDYLVYAYLQKGENELARQQMDYLTKMDAVSALNFKVAYAFAAIPARVALENKDWTTAAALTLRPDFPWNKFPWQESIIHFGRLLGSAHTGNLNAANTELSLLHALHDTLQKQKDLYKSGQVEIQLRSGAAWINFASGARSEGLEQMRTAADMEDSTSKHPVTPGEVLPARELYADMLLDVKDFKNAALAYEAVLSKSPNRFNSLAGAAFAWAKSGQKEKARRYYLPLISITGTSKSQRAEIPALRSLLEGI